MGAGSYPGPVSGPYELPTSAAARQAGSMVAGSSRAELSTLHSQLEELTTRVVAVADRYRESPDSAITAELDSAERNLLTARRSVERALKILPD